MRLERLRGRGRDAVPILVAAMLAASLAVSTAGPATAELVEDLFPATPYLGMQLSYYVNGATLGDPVDELLPEDEPGPVVRSYEGTYGDEVLIIAGEAFLELPDGAPADQAFVNAYIQARTGDSWEVLAAQEQVVDYDASNPAVVPFIAKAPTPTDPEAVVMLVVEAFPTDPALADAWVEVSATLVWDGGGGTVDDPGVISDPTPEPDDPGAQVVDDTGEVRLAAAGTLPFAIGRLVEVVAGGPGYIAVGWGVLDPAAGAEATIVTSSDGRRWDLVPLPRGASIELVDVTTWAGGYAALGWGADLGEVTAWTSVDGSDWVPRIAPRGPGRPRVVPDRDHGL